MNIDATCLNESKLHLNSKGSALLTVHFINFLKGRRPRSTIRDFPKGLRQLGKLLNMIIFIKRQRNDRMDKQNDV